MATLRQVKNWKFIKDNLMGVTTVSNDVLDFQRNWNTGSDAVEEEKLVMAMSDDEFLEYAIDTIPTTY